MNAVTKAALPEIGEAMAGGFFAGVVTLNGAPNAVIIGGKDTERTGPWGRYGTTIKDAESFIDGLANTDAMAKAGSKLAKEIRALTAGGFTDWHIPALDVLEVIYRAFKPTKEANWCNGRDGYNGHCVPMHLEKYTSKNPTQTPVPAFKKGGAQAFEERWYWSSTQCSAYYAFIQHFYAGGQDDADRDNGYLVRAVRVIPL